ncbi:MAG: O-antigen ligase family protein [Bacillota bacterium]
MTKSGTLKSKGSYSKNRSGSINNKEENKYIGILSLFIVLLVVFYSPYVRGLYFESEQLYAEILVLTAFAVYWVYKLLNKDKTFIKTPLEYAALGFPIIYFISLFASTGLRTSISEWLKYFMYFSAFIIVSRLVTTFRLKLLVIGVVVTSALGVCILGIDGMAGGRLAEAFNSFFNSMGVEKKVFFGLFVDGRMHSTIQYANALAAYIMVVLIVVLGLIVIEKKAWLRSIQLSIAFILVTTFILTQSRGAQLVFPIAFIALLVMLSKEYRIKLFVYSLIIFITSILISTRLLSLAAASQQSYAKVWLYIVVGIAVTIAASLLASHLFRFLYAVNWKVYAALASTILIGCVVTITVIMNSSAPLQLKHSDSEEETPVTLTKTAILPPGKNYKLVYKVDAINTYNKPYAYSIEILSKTEREILFSSSTLIASYMDKETKGNELREIRFSVPEGSRTVNINFKNTFKGTSSTFSEAKIVNDDTNKVVKKLMLKNKYLSNNIFSRFEGIQASYSSILRAVYYKDGLNMFKDYWLLGAGGGAWANLIFSYQSFLYWSTQAHNYVIQIATDCGVLGLLVLAAFVLSIIGVYFLQYRYKNGYTASENVIRTAIFVSILSLLMHSTIDFDLSLSSISLVLWVFTALLNTFYMHNKEFEVKEYRFPVINSFLQILSKARDIRGLNLNPVIGFVIAVLVLIVPISFKTSEEYYTLAQETSDKAKEQSYIKKAISFDSLNPTYKINYASNQIKVKNNTEMDLKELDTLVKQAEKQAWYNPDLMTRVAAYYFLRGQVDSGFKAINRSTELRPLSNLEWQQKVSSYFQLTLILFNQNNTELAMEYLEKTYNIIDEAKKVNKQNLSPFGFNRETVEMLEKIKYIKDNIKQGNTVNIDKVIFYSMPELDVDLNNKPEQFLVANSEDVKLLCTNDGIVIENDNDNGIKGHVITRELNIMPNKGYIIEIDLEGENLDTVSLDIPGVSSGEYLTYSGGKLYGKFTTPSDYNQNNRFVMLGFDRDVKIKNMVIYEE